MLKFIKEEHRNIFISYIISLCNINDYFINNSFLNNRLKVLIKKEKVGDINLFRGKKKVLIYALSAKERLYSHYYLLKVNI